MLSHMTQLLLPNEPSDATGTITPLKDLLCPVSLYLNPAAATALFLSASAACENQLSLTREVHIRANPLHSSPEVTYLPELLAGR